MGQMSRRLVGLFTRLTVVALSVFPLLGGTARADDERSSATDDAVVIQTILDQVAAQREEIASAEIHYRWHIATYRRTENTPDRVRALLDEYDLVGDPDSLRELVHTLVPEPALSIDPPWETREFFKLGDKRRANTSRGTIQLVTGDHEMTYHQDNDQLTVDSRGGSSVHKTQITDFRSFPSQRLGAEHFQVAGREDGQVTLLVIPAADAGPDVIPTRHTFDEATGVMTHSITHSRGQVYREVWQHALTEYPGGVTMPAVRVKTLYREGRLNSLTVWIVEEAHFNGPVDEDLFVLPVSEGTVLVDHRPKKVIARRVEAPTDDVRSILVPIGSSQPPEPLARGTNWRMLLILNGVGLIVLAMFLWKKGSHSTKPAARPPAGSSGVS